MTTKTKTTIATKSASRATERRRAAERLQRLENELLAGDVLAVLDGMTDLSGKLVALRDNPLSTVPRGGIEALLYLLDNLQVEFETSLPADVQEAVSSLRWADEAPVKASKAKKASQTRQDATATADVESVA